jgi:hypothetical protein
MFGPLLSKMMGIDWGFMHLKHGTHEVFVPTKVEPKRVWVTLDEKHSDGCGIVAANTISWHKRHDGVDFTVVVGTEKCKVEWLVNDSE